MIKNTHLTKFFETLNIKLKNPNENYLYVILSCQIFSKLYESKENINKILFEHLEEIINFLMNFQVLT